MASLARAAPPPDRAPPHDTPARSPAAPDRPPPPPTPSNARPHKSPPPVARDLARPRHHGAQLDPPGRGNASIRNPVARSRTMAAPVSPRPLPPRKPPGSRQCPASSTSTPNPYRRSSAGSRCRISSASSSSHRTPTAARTRNAIASANQRRPDPDTRTSARSARSAPPPRPRPPAADAASAHPPTTAATPAPPPAPAPPSTPPPDTGPTRAPPAADTATVSTTAPADRVDSPAPSAKFPARAGGITDIVGQPAPIPIARRLLAACLPRLDDRDPVPHPPQLDRRRRPHGPRPDHHHMPPARHDRGLGRSNDLVADARCCATGTASRAPASDRRQDEAEAGRCDDGIGTRNGHACSSMRSSRPRSASWRRPGPAK